MILLKHFEMKQKMNCVSCVWSSLLCIMALSTVVNCPIQSTYTPKSNTKIANLFTRKFKSCGKDPNTNILTLLWSTTESVSTYTRPNHFVLCVESNKIGLKLPPSEKTLKSPRKHSKISFYQNHGMQNLQIEVNACNSKVVIDSENKMISKSAEEGNTTAVKKTKTASTPIVKQRVINSPDTKILQPETFRRTRLRKINQTLKCQKLQLLQQI